MRLKCKFRSCHTLLVLETPLSPSIKKKLYYTATTEKQISWKMSGCSTVKWPPCCRSVCRLEKKYIGNVESNIALASVEGLWPAGIHCYWIPLNGGRKGLSVKVHRKRSKLREAIPRKNLFLFGFFQNRLDPPTPLVFWNPSRNFFFYLILYKLKFLKVFGVWFSPQI